MPKLLSEIQNEFFKLLLQKTSNMYTYFISLLFTVLLMASCNEVNRKSESVSTSLENYDTTQYHDIDFYSPEYGEFPVLDRANDLMHDNYYARAITQYNRAEQELGFLPDIYLNRGFCFSKLQNYHSAIENNTALIQFDSVYYPAYINRGMNYLDSGLYSNAIIDFKFAIGLAPARPESFVNLGLAFVEIGLLDSACHYFHKADELDAENALDQIDRHIDYYCAPLIPSF